MVKKAEIRYTQNNTTVANFTIAVNRRYVKQGEERQADFINCIAWNKTAEFIEKYFDKGQQIAIVGRLQNRNYEDNQGQKHYVTEIVVEEVYFCGSKQETQQNTQQNTQETMGDFGDDLPF